MESPTPRQAQGASRTLAAQDVLALAAETYRASASGAGVDPDTLPVMLQVAADLDQGAKLGVEHIYWNTDGDPLRQLPLLAQLRHG
jgi:hypothetical protein